MGQARRKQKDGLLDRFVGLTFDWIFDWLMQKGDAPIAKSDAQFGLALARFALEVDARDSERHVLFCRGASILEFSDDSDVLEEVFALAADPRLTGDFGKQFLLLRCALRSSRLADRAALLILELPLSGRQLPIMRDYTCLAMLMGRPYKLSESAKKAIAEKCLESTKGKRGRGSRELAAEAARFLNLP